MYNQNTHLHTSQEERVNQSGHSPLTHRETSQPQSVVCDFKGSATSVLKHFLQKCFTVLHLALWYSPHDQMDSPESNNSLQVGQDLRLPRETLLKYSLCIRCFGIVIRPDLVVQSVEDAYRDSDGLIRFVCVVNTIFDIANTMPHVYQSLLHGHEQGVFAEFCYFPTL